MRFSTLAILLLGFAAMVRADSVNTGLTPPGFTPTATDTLSGTDADSYGDTFTFNFTVQVGSENFSPEPTLEYASYEGTLSESGPVCPATGCNAYFSNDYDQFYAGGIGGNGSVIIEGWGDFTCTGGTDELGECISGVSEYQLVADQNGAATVDPQPSVATPEPSALVLLLAGIACLVLIGKDKK